MQAHPKPICNGPELVHMSLIVIKSYGHSGGVVMISVSSIMSGDLWLYTVW
jgi:hypothetical protein